MLRISAFAGITAMRGKVSSPGTQALRWITREPGCGQGVGRGPLILTGAGPDLISWSGGAGQRPRYSVAAVAVWVKDPEIHSPSGRTKSSYDPDILELPRIVPVDIFRE